MNEAEFKDMIEDSPFAGSPVKPIMLTEDATLQFRCHRDVKCWNACCSNIDIPLTPYDILRLKKRLDMSSGEFLNQYSVPFEMDKDGMPGVKLKPVEGGTACLFMTPEGCGVYEDRPTACRYYPVALLTMRRSDEYVDRSAYAMVRE
ncbi:MAG: YkgJ family cysteine cluster protein, partial [Thiobacillus sp.]